MTRGKVRNICSFSSHLALPPESTPLRFGRLGSNPGQLLPSHTLEIGEHFIHREYGIVIELLPQVIDWLERGLVPLSLELCEQRRLVIAQGDVYQHLAGLPVALCDVILIDVDHSPVERLGDVSESFYNKEGLRAARRHLSNDGVLAVWSYSEYSPFADALHTSSSTSTSRP